MHLQGRRTAAAATIALAVLVACTSCFSSRTPEDALLQDRTPAEPLAGLGCPRDAKGLGIGFNGGVRSGGIPMGFGVDQVLTCELGGSTVTQTKAATIEKFEVIESRGRPTEALLAALGLADQRLPARSNMACAMVYPAPTYLILVDGRNRGLRPVIPAHPCGGPRAEVADALASIDFTVARTHAVTRTTRR